MSGNPPCGIHARTVIGVRPKAAPPAIRRQAGIYRAPRTIASYRIFCSAAASLLTGLLQIAIIGDPPETPVLHRA
jgi:hypothetical protein